MCGKPITVRVSDYKRGWGRFCDKSCAVTFREKMRRHKGSALKFVRFVNKLLKVKRS